MNYEELGTLYYEEFWNKMRGRRFDDAVVSKGRTHNSSYLLPKDSLKKYEELKKKEDLFAGIMTRVEVLESHHIMVNNTNSSTEWVPEGADLPAIDGEEGLEKYSVESHKIASVVKLSNDFVYSPSFNLESDVLKTFAEGMSRAEEYAFINGDGAEMPYGLLHAEKGAEIGAEASALTYDDVIKLYFSVKAKYRRNGKWLMNDKTALALRTLKDKDGNYLWNQADNTILGKEVLISEFMPDEGTPILFGDFKFYRIIDRCKLNIRVLKELFATEDKIGYLGYAFMDGVLTKSEAIKSLHLA